MKRDGKGTMRRPRIYVDFNELLEEDLVLLSQTDVKPDSSGAPIQLQVGMRVHVYSDDVDEHGNPDNLVADGVVELNTAGGWASAAKWCCRIDRAGIRNESEDALAEASSERGPSS
jgi:hypothetical protein